MLLQSILVNIAGTLGETFDRRACEGNNDMVDVVGRSPERIVNAVLFSHPLPMLYSDIQTF